MIKFVGPLAVATSLLVAATGCGSDAKDSASTSTTESAVSSPKDLGETTTSTTVPTLEPVAAFDDGYQTLSRSDDLLWLAGGCGLASFDPNSTDASGLEERGAAVSTLGSTVCANGDLATSEFFAVAVSTGDNALVFYNMKSREDPTFDELGFEQEPSGVAIDGLDVWVANNAGMNVSLIDPLSHETISHIDTPMLPQDVAISGGDIWVAMSGGIDGGGAVGVFDAESNGADPTIIETDASVDALIAAGVDGSSPGPRYVIAGDSAGNVTVFSAASRSEVASFAVEGAIRQIAFDEISETVWVVTRTNWDGEEATPGIVQSFHLGTDTLRDPVPFDDLPSGIAALGSSVWVLTTDEMQLSSKLYRLDF